MVKSCKTRNTLEPNSDEDLISNLPDVVMDKILKRLPIKILARMSILSKKWRHIWLSLKYLVFDKHLWDELYDDDDADDNDDYTIRTCNCIISNILFHHEGPVYKFYLYGIYNTYSKNNLYIHGWLSLLAKVGVKKIILKDVTEEGYVMVPFSIYNCKDLVKLRIDTLELNRVPSHFKRFAYLKTLELIYVRLEYNAFRSLIANCRRLRHLTVTRLEHWNWIGENHSLVIDAPSLELLTVEGDFDNIFFENVQRLSFMSLYVKYMRKDIVKGHEALEHSINVLASSSQLQDLHLHGQMCKYFSAGCNTISHTLKFLRRLLLTNVDLSDFDEFCFTLRMLQWCPFIVDLNISVIPKKCEVEHEFCYNKNYELRNLVKVEITGITGSIPELKLIEFLLSVASKLENMSIFCRNYLYGDQVSKFKVAQDLLKVPRASPKAKVCFRMQ